MYKFKISKAGLDNNFTGINSEILGKACGELKLCGLKLFLYLSGNKDKFEWTLSPQAYANWLGVDYAAQGRAVRKMINDGVEDLKINGYLSGNGEDLVFVEGKVPVKYRF